MCKYLYLNSSKASLAPINGSNGLWMHFAQVLPDREHISRLEETEN